METYVIITWPEVQELMDKEGFSENSSLITDNVMITKYNSNAYFVNKDWLDNLEEEKEEFEFTILKEYTIWEKEYYTVEAANIEEARIIAEKQAKTDDYYSWNYETLEETREFTGKVKLYSNDNIIKEWN